MATVVLVVVVGFAGLAAGMFITALLVAGDVRDCDTCRARRYFEED